jgi:hypothetical protein
VGLQGTLNTMPVEDLIHWLAKRSATGILSFKKAGISKRLTIELGRVISAASNDPREYFGQFLINFGLVTEDQLQKAFETQQETKVLIGKILVMTGAVSEEQVHSILELKIREGFLDVFLWDQGMFEFQDVLVPDEPSVVPVSVDLGVLESEGLARQKAHKEICKLIPDKTCVFTCNQDTLPAELDRHSANGVMLHMAGEGASVADIILRFHSLDFPILKNLYDLVKRGWLSPKNATAAEEQAFDLPELEIVELPMQEETSGPDKYLMAAQSAMQGRDFDQSVSVLKQGLAEFPYDPDLCEALELAEKGLTENLKSEMLSDKRIPYLQRDDLLRISSNWTPAQRYILSRIDGHRTLRSIIMVSPLKEVEALKTFHALIKAELVGLR